MKTTKTQKVIIFTVLAALIGIAVAIISWVLLCKPEIKEEEEVLFIG